MKGFKLLLAAFILISLTTVSSAEEVVRITVGEWPPYHSKELPHYGLASRIITEAFLMEGVKVSYGFFPWPRALILAQKHEWDGTAVWFRNPEREAAFYISDPVIEAKDVFFHLKEFKFDWKGFDDLKQYRIGATQDYYYGPEFQKAEQEERIQVERATSDEINLKKLLRDRFDIFPLELRVGLNMLRKKFSPQEIERITYHPKLIYSEFGYLLLSKKQQKNRYLISIFNRGLKKLKESGKYEALFLEDQQWKLP